MFLTYEKRSDEISVEWKDSVHVPPHLHDTIEAIYVTSGTLELGVGQELYHMKSGDFAIVFPNVIHHYQVFGRGENKAVYLFLNPGLAPDYLEHLQRYSPKQPIISKELLHPDIIHSVKALLDVDECNTMLIQAYAQIILAHVCSEMEMMNKELIGSDDIIYHTVEYVAKHFREEIHLDRMAYDLGVSKYVLSRVFAKTFHCNFNQYVNGVRLSYASAMLENTHENITNICLDVGFESQRTFNRAFKEKYKMTPREYRKHIHMLKAN